MKKYEQVMTVKEMEDHEKWLQVRNTGIGGSDAASIIGMNPWKGPYELWLEKTGQKEPEDISTREAVHFGTELESLVAREFEARTGKRVRKFGTVRDREEPFLLANVDRMIVGDDAGLECKTCSAYKAREWDDDKVPDSYYVQCQHYMLVTGLPRWYIACLIGGQHYVWKAIERNEDDIAALLEAERGFWRHVKDCTPPAVDGSDSCSEALAERFRGGAQNIITLSEADQRAVRELRELEESKKQIEYRMEELKNQIKASMGDTEIAVFGDEREGGRVTWKPVGARVTVDVKRLKAEKPDVFKEYSRAGKPSRVFRMRWEEE